MNYVDFEMHGATIKIKFVQFNLHGVNKITAHCDGRNTGAVIVGLNSVRIFICDTYTRLTAHALILHILCKRLAAGIDSSVQ